jgi:hypothetical protein
MVIGFYWGGWTLGSTADKMANQRSETAVVAALAPGCAQKFRALPDADGQADCAHEGRLVEARR